MSSRENFFLGYDIKDIHDWYVDLANSIETLSGTNSTASKLLNYYLTPNKQKRNPNIIELCKNDIAQQNKKDGTSNYFGNDVNKSAGTYEIDNLYLEKIKKYTDYGLLMKNFFDIFLSKKDKTKGIANHFLKDNLAEEYKLTYYKSTGFSTFAKRKLLAIAGKLKLGSILSEKEKNELDVYVGLNSFVIKSEVTIKVTEIICNEINSSETLIQETLKSIKVSIVSWKNKLFDYYDFDANIGFPLPNPHYGNGKIHPEKKNVSFDELQHDNLVKMTNIKPPLANPFYVYKEFFETSPDLLVKDFLVTLK